MVTRTDVCHAMRAESDPEPTECTGDQPNPDIWDCFADEYALKRATDHATQTDGEPEIEGIRQQRRKIAQYQAD